MSIVAAVRSVTSAPGSPVPPTAARGVRVKTRVRAGATDGYINVEGFTGDTRNHGLRVKTALKAGTYQKITWCAQGC